MPSLLEHREIETSFNDVREMATALAEKLDLRAGALAGVTSLALAGVITFSVQLLPSSERGVPFFGKETSTTATTRDTKIRQPKTTYLELEPSLQPGAPNP